MLAICDSHHIPTNCNRKTHISCHSSTGFFMGRRDERRIYLAQLALVNRLIRFSWLVRKWTEHKARCSFAKKEEYL